MSTSEPLLDIEGLHAAYGQVKVLHGLTFSVSEGEIVVVLGANGAGKTTTLRAISGQVSARGRITMAGRSILGLRSDQVARRGIAHVPQGRGTIVDLTVEENLRVGAYTRRDKAGVAADIDRWFTSFPRLAERRGQPAGRMSGGEQQMLAIARAFMSRPRLVLLDEPSLGLAPVITQELFRTLARINAETGTALLVVEQNAGLALDIAERAYLLEAGTVAGEGDAARLKEDDSVRRAYLGY
jgi:branched-chain amino acid transport system ATP-binding protein